MNAKNAKSEGQRDGAECLKANAGITKSEYETHGRRVGMLYTRYGSTLERYCEGWNSAYQEPKPAPVVPHIESRFGFCTCLECQQKKVITN